MNEHDALIHRLHDLGTAPVDAGLAASHLTTLSTVGPAPAQPYKRGHLVVVGAMVATTFVSSAAMAGAMTGNLPGPAQDAAHTVLAKVGKDVPRSDKGQARAEAAKAANAERKAGRANKSTTKGGADDDAVGVERFLGDETTPCTLPDGSPFDGTHGDYVAAHPDDPNTTDVNEREVAAQSPCGMPLDAVDAKHDPADDQGKGNDGGTGKPATRPAGGKPADTGRPTTTTTTTVEDESTGDDGDHSGETDERTRRTGRPTTTTSTTSE